MARTKRRGKVARKSRVQTRKNNAMKPRVQTRRNNAVKKSVRRKRPRRSRGKQLGGMDGQGNNTSLLCSDDSDGSLFDKLDDAEVEHVIQAFEKIKANEITQRSFITRCLKGAQQSDSVPLSTDHEAYKEIVIYLNSDSYKIDMANFITNNVTKKKNKSKDIHVYKADFSDISYFSGFPYSILRFEYDVTKNQVSDLRLKKR